MSEAGFKSLGALLLSKLDMAKADGSLGKAPAFHDVMASWRHIEGAEAIKAWLSGALVDDVDLTERVCSIIVVYSNSIAGESVVLNDPPEQDLFDWQVLHDATSQHLTDTHIAKDRQRLFKAVNVGLRRLLHGEPLSEQDEL